MDDLLALLRARRSVRDFQPELPPRDLLEGLIEAAITAPSASNRQPWRFLIVSDARRIGELGVAVREAAERIGGHIAPAYRDAFRDYGDYFTRFAAAPAVIVPLCRSLTTLSNMVGPGLGAVDRQRICAMEDASGLVSAALALQNLLLAAHAAGLGASCMTGPLIAADRVHEILGVGGAWRVVALVPVGYPAGQPAAAPGRKPAASVIRWLE